MSSEHVDVLIVGAGISGIGAGYHLQARCPDHSYLILEGREAIGGTWDLFRYPGVRSDSDMYTLGFSFRPWTDDKSIADGASILKYLNDTAREYGIDRRIRFGHRVTSAHWSSASSTWTLEVEQGAERTVRRFTCNFLYMCGGYYNYDHGYEPDFPGRERFSGRIVHPQQWPDDLQYAGKRVVVIGSGATAVTLLPELAREAEHVTMLQRSPTYVVSRPSVDALANRLRRWLPTRLAYALTRWKNVLLGMYFYNLCRSRPKLARDGLIKLVREQLGPDFDVDTHFTPRYNPWEQRLCLVPDGDLFKAIRSGRASVVTDRIDTFTEHGIRLVSGQELAADVIVTATGLELQFLSGIEFTVDGQKPDLPRCLSYKAMMYSGVPNLAVSFGYTNASWTLKADLTSEYVCRLLDHMRRTGTTRCVPVLNDPTVTPEPWVDFSSGYFQRAQGMFPAPGSKAPWKLHQNYARDILMLRLGQVDDGVMQFSAPHASAATGLHAAA
ncbi:MAG TPA: NAD(P)/FAD-dependent oxidoreductase [Burkholderiaceae bacterium]|nr:NAD(P)/FAD-dependent oxidoreductase [Burkholderiaceae bacterium]